jgi:hypothetical protein
LGGLDEFVTFGFVCGQESIIFSPRIIRQKKVVIHLDATFLQEPSQWLRSGGSRVVAALDSMY